jgi:hypothetical protein
VGSSNTLPNFLRKTHASILEVWKPWNHVILDRVHRPPWRS